MNKAVLLGEGERLKSLRANRNKGNMQPQEERHSGHPPECTRYLGGERLSGSNRGTLDEMHYIGDRELVEPTSKSKTGHQVRDGVAIPQSKL